MSPMNGDRVKIVILDGYTANPGDLSWEGFSALGDLTVYDRTPPALVRERIGDAQAVIINKTVLSHETLSACPSIRYIGLLSTGYNVVNIEAARERGIPVCNVPAYGTAAVAQLVFALLLEICHRVWSHSEAVKAGKWSASEDFCFWDHPLIELAGKTMGIVGFGRIGRAVCAIARAMGMEVLAHDEFPASAGMALAEHVSLERLFASSDVISLHCPLFPSNQGMINRRSIAHMKDGAILINTARGGLVVEQDLADALNTGKLYAAGIDVLSTEPVQQDNPLLSVRNCIVTPHIAWAPKESRQRLMDQAAENLRAFLSGMAINVVNP